MIGKFGINRFFLYNRCINWNEYDKSLFSKCIFVFSVIEKPNDETITINGLCVCPGKGSLKTQSCFLLICTDNEAAPSQPRLN